MNYLQTASLANKKGYRLSDMRAGRTKTARGIMLSKPGKSPEWVATFKEAKEFLDRLEDV